MNYNLEKLKNGLEYLGISVSDFQIDQLLKFYEMLIEKNKVMNLTAITDFDEVIQKHFIDSISIVKVMDMQGIKSMIDIGTGAGFPGIPIKIAFPHIKVTLMDSLNKRVKFLGEVVDALQLEDVATIHGRAEDLAQKAEHREVYDISVSRAVANLNSLCEYCLPFVKIDGYFISYKSGKVEEELEKGKTAIKILGGQVKSVTKFELPDSDISRSFISIQKIKKCSLKYPRKAGLPTSAPL